jgi:hypothetical protein
MTLLAPPSMPDVKDQVLVMRSLTIAATSTALEFHLGIFDQSQGVPVWRVLTCFMSIAMAAAILQCSMRAQSFHCPCPHDEFDGRSK